MEKKRDLTKVFGWSPLKKNSENLGVPLIVFYEKKGNLHLNDFLIVFYRKKNILKNLYG